MDYAYITRGGQNEELRYSIRSVEKFMPAGEVYLFGEKPNWYIGKYTRVLQRGHKYDNARKNLKQICVNDEISDTFVLMNDDFFAIEDVPEIQTYHGGLLKHKIETYQHIRGRGAYTRLLEKTYKGLRRMGIEEPLDYELHVPMIMTKSGLESVLETDMLWRSSYGNINQVGGTRIFDVKVYHDYPYTHQNECPYLSSSDESFAYVYKKYLKEKLRYSPSRYELR